MDDQTLDALAAAISRLVSADDIAGNLLVLMTDCVDQLGAEAAGLMVVTRDSGLELLGSTSHRAEELEMYELQHESGPCIQAIRTGEIVTASTEEALAAWEPVGSAMRDSGFQQIYAFPLRWRGVPLGALNLFSADPEPLNPRRLKVGQVFADLITVLIAQPPTVDANALHGQIVQGLDGRVVIEQAKGIIAYQHRLGMAEAFTMLVEVAENQRRPLGETAAEIVAHRGLTAPQA